MVTGNLGRIGGYTPLSEEFGSYDKMEQGFIKESFPRDVKQIRASLEIKNIEDIDSRECRNELIRSLVRQLIEDDAVVFKRMENPSEMYGTTPLLTATLRYIEPKGRNNNFYIIQEEVFNYNNQKWTQEEIFESLKNTFPERFI
jgi:hypothetical protein